MEVKSLKLIARTQEDLRVVSAYLQDSIANVIDVANLKKNKIFFNILPTCLQVKPICLIHPQKSGQNTNLLCQMSTISKTTWTKTPR